MDEYIKNYNAATRKVLDLAREIDGFALQQFDAEYSLYDITSVLRQKYADASFRKKYVGNLPFRGFVPYTKGFCALTTICIYELYGSDAIWTPSAIKMGAWEHAPVVFLRDNIYEIAFDPTGDQFSPLRVPYELGTPINKRMRDMKTPNKAQFIAEIKKELDRR